MSAGPVVLTYARGSFPGLADAVRALPADVIESPLLTFAPPLDWAPVDRAVRELATYSAIAFTSPRAADAFAARYRELGGGALPQVWASGSGTAASLASLAAGVRTPRGDEAGTLGAAAALAAAMLDESVTGPVLFPCGEVRRDELPMRLRQEGITVDEVVCYRSVIAGEDEARDAVRRAGILVVASPTVAELLARSSAPTPRPPLLAVGPTTAAAARAAGWAPDAVAARPEADALLAEIASLLAERQAR